MKRRAFLQFAIGVTAAGIAVWNRSRQSADESDDVPPRVHPDIWRTLTGVRVLDTHEHQEEERDRLRRTVDFMDYLRHYSLSDFRSAGLTSEAIAILNREDAAPADKWRVLRPFWASVRHTGYLQAAMLAIRRLHGVEELNVRTVQQITDELRRNNRPGYVRHVFREVCRIDNAQVNALEPGTVYRSVTDPEIFLQDISGLRLMLPFADLPRMQQETSIAIHRLADYENAVASYFERYGREASAVKNQCAYSRILRFGQVGREEAARLFDRWLSNRRSLRQDEVLALGDYSWNYIVSQAREYDLTVKIHTGYMAGNNSLELDRIRPGHLTSLFRRFPDVRFDLFHMGYPHEHETMALVKQYTNVYADLTWAPIVNPVQTQRFVEAFLVSCPSTKLFAFGGDYRTVDPVYGHLWITQAIVGRALTRLVEEGHFTLKEACDAGQAAFRDNVERVFGVTERLTRLRQRLGRPDRTER